MTIITSQGRRVETIEFNGHPTPFRHGDFFVIRVAVDGQPCPGWQVPAQTWQEEQYQLSEPEFWQNVADAALSMGEARASGILQI